MRFADCARKRCVELCRNRRHRLSGFANRVAFANAQDHIESGLKRRFGLGPDADIRLSLCFASLAMTNDGKPRAGVEQHGRIAAGTPIEALQGTEGFAVPAALLGPGEHYALEVSGDSMVEEGILDGDYALIRKVDTARDGEIVVALIDNEEATLKTYRREGQMIRLDPANRAYEPQRYDEGRVTIQGRLSGLIRRY